MTYRFESTKVEILYVVIFLLLMLSGFLYTEYREAKGDAMMYRVLSEYWEQEYDRGHELYKKLLGIPYDLPEPKLPETGYLDTPR